MPIQDLLDHIKGENLTADQKCNEASAWLGNVNNILSHDELKLFFARIEKYASNDGKWYVRQKNKLTRAQANSHKKEIGKVWFRSQTYPIQTFPELTYDEYVLYADLRPNSLQENSLSWLRRCKVSSETFLNFMKTKLSNVSSNHQTEFFTTWYLRDGNELSEEQFLEVKSLISGIPEKEMKELLRKFFSKNQNQPPRNHQLLNLLAIQKMDDLFKLVILNHNFEQLANVLCQDNSHISTFSDEKKNLIIKAWLEQTQNKMNIDQLQNSLASNQALEEAVKKEFFRSWFAIDGNNLSEEQFLNLFPSETWQVSPETMQSALRIFFNKNKNQPPRNHQLLNLLSIYGVNDVLSSVILNHNYAQLIDAFKANNDQANKWNIKIRTWIIRSWIESGQNKPSAEELKNLLEFCRPEVSVQKKQELIMLACNKLRSKAEKIKYFESIVKSRVLDRLNDYDQIFHQLSRMLGNEDEDLRLASDFCREVYNGVDMVKTNFFRKFIKEKYRGRNLDEEKSKILSTFLESVADDGEVIFFIGKIERYFRPNVTPAQIVSLVKKRTSGQYDSLKELLDGQKVSESVNQESLAGLRSLFGDNVINMTLLDIFSYYNVQEGATLQAFRGLLKPEVLGKMDASFKIKSDICCLTKKEYESLKSLVPSLTLPPVAILGQALKSKIKILSINDDQIAGFKINFDEGFYEQEKPNDEAYNNNVYPLALRKELGEDFKKILQNNPADLLQRDEMVLHFFTKLLKKHKTYFDDLGTERVKEFCQFVHRNKKEIAFMLLQSDGVDVVRNVFFSIGDGCANNITSVFNTALIEYSIRKSQVHTTSEIKALTVLYQFYNDDIFTAQINRNNNEGGEFYVGNSANPLDHQGILDCHICADGMIKKINSKFQDSEKKYEYLCDALTAQNSAEKVSEFKEILSSVDDLLFRFDYLLAYAIIHQVVPELANQLPRFAQAKKDFEKIQAEIILNNCHNVNELVFLLEAGGAFSQKTLQEKSELVLSWIEKDNVTISPQDEKALTDDSKIFLRGSKEYREISKALTLKRKNGSIGVRGPAVNLGGEEQEGKKSSIV